MIIEDQDVSDVCPERTGIGGETIAKVAFALTGSISRKRRAAIRDAKAI